MSENGAFSLSAHPLIFYVNVFSASLHRYRKAVDAYACLQSASFKSAFQGDSAVAQAELARIENERHEIQQLLSPDHHRKLMEKGLKRLSFNATIAALILSLMVVPATFIPPFFTSAFVGPCCLTFFQQV